MPFKALLLDTSILPHNVLSYYDDDFYDMVGRIAGFTEAKLLEIQGVRSVYSFLNTEDVFSILSISCSALNDIKSLVCLEADDNTFIVKPGYRSSIQYLYQLLLQKHQEHMKEIGLRAKFDKQTRIHSISTSVDTLQDPVGPASILGIDDEQSIEITGQQITESDYRNMIIGILNEWYAKNSRENNNFVGQLIENEDYQLLVSFKESSDQASIICSCGVKVQLTKVRGNTCLSNYYKHLKSKSCSMIRKKKSTNHDTTENLSVADHHNILNAESSLDISVKEKTSYDSSNVLSNLTMGTVESVKRSVSQQKRVFSKRQRL